MLVEMEMDGVLHIKNKPRHATKKKMAAAVLASFSTRSWMQAATQKTLHQKNRLDTLGLYTHYMLLVWCKCNYFHFTFYQRSHNVTCYLLLENYHTNNNSNNAACSTLGA